MRSSSLFTALLAFCLTPVAIVEVSQRVRADLVVPAPIAPMPMPFLRAGDPTVIPGVATPKQYLINQIEGTVTYRAFNPCSTADVRIKSVKALEPVTTEPTQYPGVLLVTSKTETVDKYSGTRYGRGAETMGSTVNPNGGYGRIVSVMIVPVPGYTGYAGGDVSSLTCEFELQYGRSG